MFHLTIRTPYEDIFSGEVKSLLFSAEEAGEMQIFEDHASLTATVDFSPIVIEENDKDEHFLGRNGTFLFNNEENSAVLLLTYCQKKSEVTYKTVKEYAEYITKQIEEGHELSEFQINYLSNEKIAVEKQMEEVEDKA